MLSESSMTSHASTRRKRHRDCCEFKTNLGCRVSAKLEPDYHKGKEGTKTKKKETIMI